MINTYQVSVGASAVKLLDVPPGPAAVVLTNAGTAAVAIGTTNAVTATNGGVIPVNGTVTIPGFAGSKSIALWAIAAGGTNPVGIFVSATG